MTIATLVTSMKDEAPYIIEWVAYHKSIGFDRIVVLANDCADGTHEMLQRLHSLGEIFYEVNEVPLGGKPHSLALRKAQGMNAVTSSDYTMVLDADEFLVIKDSPNKVHTLIDMMKQIGSQMMVIPWRLFGSSSNASYEDRPVIDRFTRSMSDSDPKKYGVKTLFKNDPSLRLAIHFPKNIMKNGKRISGDREFVWSDPDGQIVDHAALSWNGGRNRIGRGRAEVAHFMIKSLDEYLLKIFRGDGLMNSSRHGIAYWMAADRNETENLRILDHASGFRSEFKKLSDDPVLSELHRNSVAKRKQRLREILDNPLAVRLREILWSSTAGTVTAEDISDSHALVKELSPQKAPPLHHDGKLLRSLLLNFVSAELSDAPALRKAIVKTCRKADLTVWAERDFIKRPITLLREGLKHAQRQDRDLHVGVRLLEDYSLSPTDANWAVHYSLTLLFTRDNESIIEDYPAYMRNSSASYLKKKNSKYQPSASALTGAETALDIADLISRKVLEDPRERLRNFLKQHPEAFVFNLDHPKDVQKQLETLRSIDVAGKTASDLVEQVINALDPELLSVRLKDSVTSEHANNADPMSNSGDKPTNAVNNNGIGVYWFRRGGGNTSGNFGDELGPLVVSYLTGRPSRYAEPADCDLASIGSILSQVSKQAARSCRSSDLFIWGSGLIEEDIHQLYSCLKPLAVRGQSTRDALGLRDDLPLGDPGILSSRLVKAQKKKHKWGIVPHFSHRKSKSILEIARENKCLLIDPTDPAEKVLKAISSCYGIVSSSLHGLIVADSYSIPCVWLDIKSHKSHDYKFADYCSGVARDQFYKVELPDLRTLTSQGPHISPFQVDECIMDRLCSSLTERFCG